MIFAILYSEDGDIPPLKTFSSREAFLRWVREDEVDPSRLIADPTTFNPERSGGKILVIEGSVLTMRPKKVVQEWEIA